MIYPDFISQNAMNMIITGLHYLVAWQLQAMEKKINHLEQVHFPFTESQNGFFFFFNKMHIL